MRGPIQTRPIQTPAPLVASRGERITFLMLALAFVGAVIPVGPAIPSATQMAVAATCPGPDASGMAARCAEAAYQEDTIEPPAALRIAAMFLP